MVRYRVRQPCTSLSRKELVDAIKGTPIERAVKSEQRRRKMKTMTKPLICSVLHKHTFRGRAAVLATVLLGLGATATIYYTRKADIPRATPTESIEKVPRADTVEEPKSQKPTAEQLLAAFQKTTTSVDVAGDGHCMYHAALIGHELSKGKTLEAAQKTDTHKAVLHLRRRVHEHVCADENLKAVKNDRYCNIPSKEDIEAGRPMPPCFSQRIGEECWGGEPEIKALSDIWGVAIFLMDEATKQLFHYEPKHFNGHIFLKRKSQCHYNVVRMKDVKQQL